MREECGGWGQQREHWLGQRESASPEQQPLMLSLSRPETQGYTLASLACAASWTGEFPEGL